MRKLACHFLIFNRGTRFFPFEPHSKKCPLQCGRLILRLFNMIIFNWHIPEILLS